MSGQDAPDELRPGGRRLRLLIADDQPLMRAGFRAVLEATGDMEVIAEASDGVEAVALAKRLRPDVVLMDIRMPLLDGIAATRQLPGDRVLILTTFGLDDYIIEALRAGARKILHAPRPIDSAPARFESPPPPASVSRL